MTTSKNQGNILSSRTVNKVSKSKPFRLEIEIFRKETMSAKEKLHWKIERASETSEN